MKKRIFVAINLPQNAKESLSEYQQKWQESLPAKWVSPENLHITLVFIGEVTEQAIPEIKTKIQNIISLHKPFSVSLDKISYSPYKKEKEVPRMVWVSGEANKEFPNLKKGLEKALGVKPENRGDVIHITLARIKEWQWQRIEPDERPEIEEFVELKIPVDSIELMESVLKKSGPEYSILESYKL